MALDLRALEPPPTKVVANLPYGIAAGAILRTIEELPGVTRWVAMVQKEVGERLAAAPGTRRLRRAVGARAARLRGARAPRRSRAPSSTPVPNVDSVLVVLERTGPPPPPEVRALVQAAFAHRRKALARSLALAAGARRRRARPRPRGARRPSATRPTRAPSGCAPRGRPRARGRRASDVALREEAPGQAQPLPVPRAGPRASDGRHELVTLFQPLTLPTSVARARAAGRRAADEVVCPGVEGDNLAAARSRAFRERDRLGRPARPAGDRQAHPGRRRDGRRLGRRRRRAAPGRPRRGRADDALLREIAAGLGADVPAQVRPARYLATGAGERLRRARAAPATACSSCPRATRSPPPRCTRRPTAWVWPRRGAASWPPRSSGRRARAAACSRRAGRQRPRARGPRAVPRDRRRARRRARRGRRPGARVRLGPDRRRPLRRRRRGARRRGRSAAASRAPLAARRGGAPEETTA